MCYVWRVTWYGPATCQSGNKKCFRCRIVVTSSVTNMGVKLFMPQQKEICVRGWICLSFLEQNMQEHGQQSRHVAGHYLPEEKENDSCTVFPGVIVTRRTGEKTICAFYGNGKIVVPLLPAPARKTVLSQEQRGDECLENNSLNRRKHIKKGHMTCKL